MKVAEADQIRPLKAEDQQLLDKLEEIIKKGKATYNKVGEALFEIREKRLYQATHKTFAQYCLEKWGFTKTHANRQIKHVEVAHDLAPLGVIPTEYMSRALSPYPTNVRKKATKRALNKVGGNAKKLTQPVMRQSLDETLGGKLKNSEEHRKTRVKPLMVNRHDLLKSLENCYQTEWKGMRSVKKFFEEVKRHIRSF